MTIIPSFSLAKKPGTYEDIKVPELEWKLPEYGEFQTTNNISGLVVEDDEVPLVYFTIAFPASPDPEDKVGLAEMTAWTLRNGGSTNIPADSLNDLVEYKAAWLGISAGQEQLRVNGFSHKDDLPFMLGLARELIENPAYPDDKIALKRSTMLEEIRRRYDRPNGIAHRELNKLIYPGHPWGRETGEGTLGAIERKDLLGYHNRVFNLPAAVIGFSGDVKLAEVRDLTEECFGGMKSKGEEISPLPPAPETADPGIYYFYKDVNQAFVTMGHQTIRYDDPRRQAAQIMNYILGGGGFNSLLTKRIRVDEGLSYSVWSSFTASVPLKGCFKASASTRLDQAGRTLTLMREIIENYRENGPTEEEFGNAKQAFVNSYVWKYESSDDILYRLTYLKWRGLPLDSPQRDLEAYQNLTLADVKQAAETLLHPENLIVVLVGDKDKMDRPLTDFGEVHELKGGSQ